MKTTTNNNLSAIATLLENNSHYAKKYVNKDFAEFKKWNECNNAMLVSFYGLYASMHNGTYTTEKENKAYKSLTDMLHYIGKVNGDFIKCNAMTINENGVVSTLFNDCLAFSWKFDTKKVPTLQLKESQYRNVCTMLEEYEGKNGVEAKTIEALKADKATLKAEIDALYEVADNAIVGTSIATLGSFSKNFEKKIRQVITKQSMKSIEEILAEKKAKEEERKARRAKKNK